MAYKSYIVSYKFRGLMFNQGIVLFLLLLVFSGFMAARSLTSYLVLGSVALINTGIIHWVYSIFALHINSRSDWTSFDLVGGLFVLCIGCDGTAVLSLQITPQKRES